MEEFQFVRLISLMVSCGPIWGELGCRRRTERWLHGVNQKKNYFSDFFSGLGCKMLISGQHSENPRLKHWHSRTFRSDLGDSCEPVCNSSTPPPFLNRRQWSWKPGRRHSWELSAVVWRLATDPSCISAARCWSAHWQVRTTAVVTAPRGTVTH